MALKHSFTLSKIGGGKDWSLSDFTTAWQDSVPEGALVDTKLLAGIAVMVQLGSDTFIRYLPASDMRDISDVRERIRILRRKMNVVFFSFDKVRNAVCCATTLEATRLRSIFFRSCKRFAFTRTTTGENHAFSYARRCTVVLFERIIHHLFVARFISVHLHSLVILSLAPFRSFDFVTSPCDSRYL